MRFVPMLAAIATGFLLAACSDTSPSGTAPTAQAQAAQTAAPATTAPVGHYRTADTRVTFLQATRLPDKGGALRFLLTPEVLDANEQATLRAESWPGLSLLNKHTAHYPDRYPFVVIEVRTEDGSATSPVKHFYVMASGIAAANHTDNINRSHHDHGVELLEERDGRVHLRAAGHEDFSGGEPREWAFDISG